MAPIGHPDASAVCNRLPESELPVNHLPLLEFITPELVRDTPCPLLELVERVGIPPIVDNALPIVQRTFVVEPVRHLVPKYAAEGTELPRRRISAGEEWLLQHPSWDVERVLDQDRKR